MSKVTLLDTTGKEVKEVTLPKGLFSVEVNENLIAQAIRTRMHNAWLGTRRTKSRGEVSGGGRKPWRQKGTGRARHGSIRSPIWVGGGHTHPLRPVDNRLKMPKQMRRKALFSALSGRLGQGKVTLVQNWEGVKPKTKEALSFLKNIKAEGKVLLVVAEKDSVLAMAFNNIENVVVREARLLHPYDILHSDVLVLFEDSVSKLKDTFLGGK